VPKCFPTRESSQQCDFHCSWTWGAQLAISLNPQGFRLLFLPALPSPFAPRGAVSLSFSFSLSPLLPPSFYLSLSLFFRVFVIVVTTELPQCPPPALPDRMFDTDSSIDFPLPHVAGAWPHRYVRSPPEMSPPSTSTPDPVPPPFWLTFLPVCQITARNVSPLHLHSRPSVPSCSSTQRTLSFFTCLWIICHLYECLMSHSRPKLDGFFGPSVRPSDPSPRPHPIHPTSLSLPSPLLPTDRNYSLPDHPTLPGAASFAA